MASDAELVVMWADGDAAAGRAFYAVYAQRITRFFAHKVGQDAADLVQTTFLKALDATRSGDRPDHVGAWLFTIARNVLYDFFRAKKRYGDRFTPAQTSLADLETGASGQLARHEDRRLLMMAIRQLPIEQQLALELYYWEGLGMEHVAQVLGVTRSAALNRVHRARARLREALTELADSPAQLSDTVSGFDTWAMSVRGELPPDV